MAAKGIANIAIEYGLVPVAHLLIRFYLLSIKLHGENEDMIINIPKPFSHILVRWGWKDLL